MRFHKASGGAGGSVSAASTETKGSASMHNTLDLHLAHKGDALRAQLEPAYALLAGPGCRVSYSAT